MRRTLTGGIELTHGSLELFVAAQIDGCTHLSLELGYALITIFYGGARFGPTTGIIGYLCDIWRLYGKADPRWTIFAQDILALYATVQ